MAEKIISPGVFTSEIDQTFLPAAVSDIGAAIVGPTVKGPALVPTVVTSYSEFQAMFGDSFKSGSNSYTYMTSLAAKQYLQHSNTLTVVRILDAVYGPAHATIPTGSTDGTYHTGSSLLTDFGESAGNASFKLHTLSDGDIMNNADPTKSGYSGGDLGTNGIITNSGSKHNLRWEIPSVNPTKGTFTLLVRRGDDSDKRKTILETWNNLSLDPGENNYIVKVIGDKDRQVNGTVDEPYVEYSGSVDNKSKYIRVEVLKDTLDYLDTNGKLSTNAGGHSPQTSSLPGINSGSFVGGSNGYVGFDALGKYKGSASEVAMNFYENI